MRYRLGKPCDIKEIVNIHYSIRESYSIGVFAHLGKSFLHQYYKIILNDKNQLVVCAEDENGRIQGFCSATLNVESQFANIRNHKLALGFSAIKSIVRDPSLLKSLAERYKSLCENGAEKFIVTKGARGEYWAWSKTYQDSISALEMHEVHLKILKDLGVKQLNFEVDTINKKVLNFHKFNGAEITKIMILPDGRERVLMRYNLVDRKSRL